MDSEAERREPERGGRHSALRAQGLPLRSVPQPEHTPTTHRRRPRHERLRFEQRLRLWLAALALPFLLTLFLLLRSLPLWLNLVCVAAAGLAWSASVTVLYEAILRPLQTLSNVVVALREQDFSLRARGGRRGDALGDLALEINALASQLQAQRSEAQDAVSLAERVIGSMLSPVIAFDAQGRLRLLNASAERTFRLALANAYGSSAAQLGLTPLVETPDRGVLTLRDSESSDAKREATTRWSVRRTGFRLRGLPHTLFLLSDVDAALREEERIAWQRLIRVLGHEINNSLTPIKSIAETLRSRLGGAPPEAAGALTGFDRGLSIIEERSASLNRFLQAYQQISRLPPPRMLPVDLRRLLRITAMLETRLNVQVENGPVVKVLGDADQLEQMLINLVRNATDAAFEAANTDGSAPSVSMAWAESDGRATVRIVDNGPGLANPRNLFVPFYTTKVGGTGIGLVFAQQIAAAHGGSVRLANRMDARGCAAEVDLPLAAG